MILRITHPEDRFKVAAKVLEVINNLHLINELHKEMKSTTKIDPTILYEVIETIYKDAPFTDEQLLSCFSVIDELNVFHNIITKFTDIETTLPLEVELLLFGIKSNEQCLLSPDKIFEYENIISDNMYRNPFDYPNLIGRIQNVQNCIHKELAV